MILARYKRGARFQRAHSSNVLNPRHAAAALTGVAKRVSRSKDSSADMRMCQKVPGTAPDLCSFHAVNPRIPCTIRA